MKTPNPHKVKGERASNTRRLNQLALTFLWIALITCNVQLLDAQTGWGAHPAQTPVQKAIVASANAAANKQSGQSVIQTTGTQGCDSKGWCTDTAGGDGPRMRAAINRYYGWYFSNSKPESLQSVTGKMQTIDLAGSAYAASTKTTLVNQIVNVLNGKAARGPFLKPTTDNETLQFLSVQKQCLEWAMTTAIAAGGAARSYGSTAVTDPQKWRPGMALYKKDSSHAMIIIDIFWNAQGLPTQFKVAESNFGTGWTNPLGMPPWSRVVATGRTIPLDAATYKVVSYE